MSGTLDTDVTLDTGSSVDVTVYEDLGATGSADNTETVSVGGGTNSYSLSNIEGGSGNDYWLKVELSTGTGNDGTSTPTVHSLTLDVPAAGSVARSTGGVRDTNASGVITTQ